MRQLTVVEPKTTGKPVALAVLRLQREQRVIPRYRPQVAFREVESLTVEHQVDEREVAGIAVAVRQLALDHKHVPPAYGLFILLGEMKRLATENEYQLGEIVRMQFLGALRRLPVHGKRQRGVIEELPDWKMPSHGKDL